MAENRVHACSGHFFIFPKAGDRFLTMPLSSVCFRLVQDLHFDYKADITIAGAKKQAMSCPKRVCARAKKSKRDHMLVNAMRGISIQKKQRYKSKTDEMKGKVYRHKDLCTVLGL